MPTEPTSSAEMQKLLEELKQGDYSWVVAVGGVRTRFVPLVLSYIRTLEKELKKQRPCPHCNRLLPSLTLNP